MHLSFSFYLTSNPWLDHFSGSISDPFFKALSTASAINGERGLLVVGVGKKRIHLFFLHLLRVLLSLKILKPPSLCCLSGRRGRGALWGRVRMGGTSNIVWSFAFAVFWSLWHPRSRFSLHQVSVHLQALIRVFIWFLFLANLSRSRSKRITKNLW